MFLSFVLPNIQCSVLVARDDGFITGLIHYVHFRYHINLSHGSVATYLYGKPAASLFKVDGTFTPYKLFRPFCLIYLLY